MNRKEMLSFFGLKWNPFSRDLVADALIMTPMLEHFLWQIECLTEDGGIAMLTGESGTGKSSAMQMLYRRLSESGDATIACINRPQSNMTDFYREIGDGFGVSVGASNRWGGFDALRKKWLAIVESKLVRPILLIDEAQEMNDKVFSELRILSADQFDSRCLLTIVLAGDSRLPKRLQTPDLQPLRSRIRTQVTLEAQTVDDAASTLKCLLEEAGNANLFTDQLSYTIAEHALGNFRAIVTIANKLLMEAAKQRMQVIDEQLYLKLTDRNTKELSRPKSRRRRAAERG